MHPYQEALLASADLGTPAKRKRVAKDLGIGKERVLHGHIEDVRCIEDVLQRIYLNLCKKKQKSTPFHKHRHMSSDGFLSSTSRWRLDIANALWICVL